jgi:hypothetical protein
MFQTGRFRKTNFNRLLVGGTDITNAATNAVAGAAAGYKLARGVSAITGTGTVSHGLATVVAVMATLKDDVSLAGNEVSAAVSGTTVTLKVWKPTSNTDCTPIAATAAKNVHWLVIGT